MRGLVVGRFQPLHNGHAALIKAAIEDCVHVVIGVGSSTAKASVANPFNFEERMAMIQAAFPEVEIMAIPDIHDPPRWADHVQGITGPVDCVYGNDEQTLSLFEDSGVPVKETGLTDRAKHEGRTIRLQIAEGDGAWRKAVPKPVVEILDSLEAGKRMRILEATT